MPEFIPHGIKGPLTTEEDPRLGRWLAGQNDPHAAELVLLGFPSDEGVRRNGGRPGAAGGPAAIREALYRLTPDAEAPGPFISLLERTADVGDTHVTGDVETDQRHLGEAVAELLGMGKTIVILGGGHETTFGHFLGYVGAGLKVDILNLDAHADVRPLREGKAHSGSPFFQALTHESGACGRYRVAGLQPHSTAAAHVDFVIRHGGEVVWREETDRDRIAGMVSSLHGPAITTFDFDALDAAVAPGVSAPNPGGLPADVWLRAAFEAGRSSSVRSVDLVELNPSLDVDARTVRLAALTVWQFMRGLSLRGRHS